MKRDLIKLDNMSEYRSWQELEEGIRRAYHNLKDLVKERDEIKNISIDMMIIQGHEWSYSVNEKDKPLRQCSSCKRVQNAEDYDIRSTNWNAGMCSIRTLTVK